MADIEALRAAMRGAEVFGKGSYFQEGKYELVVDKAIYKASQGKEHIIFEFKVLSTNVKDLAVGSTRSSVFSFHHQGWLNRLKALMIALQGVDPEAKVQPEVENMATELYIALRDEPTRIKMGLPENFLAGLKVNAEGFKGTSKKGGPVTNMKWTPAPKV